MTPETGLVDEPFDVRVTGAAPGGSVTITVTAESEGGAPWRLTREARADDAGGVVLPAEHLLAQLRPGRGAPEDDFLMPPFALEVTAASGDEEDETTVRRVIEPDGVEITELRVDDDGFRARWRVPGDGARRTAILLLGGSNGGLGSRLRAGVLAGHGYHVLQLAYFSEEGLPDELLRIPLEYFRTAIEWLGALEGIDSGRIVVFGVSRGGELALLLGSTTRTSFAQSSPTCRARRSIPRSSIKPSPRGRYAAPPSPRRRSPWNGSQAESSLSAGGRRALALRPVGRAHRRAATRERPPRLHGLELRASRPRRRDRRPEHVHADRRADTGTASSASAARRRPTRPRGRTRGPGCSASSRVSDGRDPQS